MAKRGRTYQCGIEASLDVIGGKWKAAIIWHLGPSPLRFGELRRAIAGITEKMLIQQLRELVADGLVQRKDYREVPPKVEYALTDFGRSLRAALGPLCDWGVQHMRRIGLRRARVDGDGKKSKRSDPGNVVQDEPSDSLSSSPSRRSPATGSHSGKGMTSHSDNGMR
jgi:DNA-binding HxlR family transcriptional regulator